MAIDYKTPYHWHLAGVSKEMRDETLFLTSDYIRRGYKVLDIGCGDGYMTNEIAKKGCYVTGLDISDSGLEFAKQLSGDSVIYKKGDVCDLPFARSTFDVVTAFEVIEHLEPGSIGRAIDEIHRVLRPYGVFILTTPNKNRILNCKNDKHQQEFSTGGLKKLLSQRFNCLEMAGIYLYVPVLGLFSPFRSALMLAGYGLPWLSWRLFYAGRKEPLGSIIIQKLRE